MSNTWKAVIFLGFNLSVSAWAPPTQRAVVSRSRRWAPVVASAPEVISPFADRLEDDDDEGDDPDDFGAANPTKAGGTYELTLENVEMILDEMRPYLISDGGNGVFSFCALFLV